MKVSLGCEVTSYRLEIRDEDGILIKIMTLNPKTKLLIIEYPEESRKEYKVLEDLDVII